ncbi:MAG: chemotaxis protein CheB [Roseiflexaceae bacterium]
MPMRDIIVVGGSAGGIEALQRLVHGLPSDLPAAMLVVLHTHPTSPGYLPQILSRNGPLLAEHAADGAPLSPGKIMIAPPDHHLLIEGEHVRLTRGPKENRSRPAIDPLFRSAAYFYGPRVIGVVLSGMLDDGTAGLWTIKDRDGLAVVQELEDAAFPSMPESALRHVAVDYQMPATGMGPLLGRLAREAVPEADLPAVPKSLEIETRIAMEDSALDRGIFQLGDLSPFTCPECHGVMVQVREGGRLRFRCHTGHAFSANNLLSGLTASIEEALWNAMRGVEESGMLMQHMARHLAEQGDAVTASRFAAKAQQAHQRAQLLKQLATQQEQFSEDQLRSDTA